MDNKYGFIYLDSMPADYNTLVVLIPAYNEADTVGEVVRAIPRDALSDVKVLVVDDGSKDKTYAVAFEAGADKIIRHKRNMGLGVAFKRGVDEALIMDADIIVNIDADMQFNPVDIPKLIKPILDGSADFTVCSRFLDKNLEPDMPWIKNIGNKLFSKLISYITQVKLTDTQCGFRAYSREAALRINTFSRFTYTQESLIDLLGKGLAVEEVPLKAKGERNGKSRVVSSITFYVFRSFAILIRTVRDYRSLEFFGLIGLTIFNLGLLIEAGMLAKWILTGTTSPYQSLITGGVILLVLGFLLLILALQADMTSRQRKIVEEVLYKVKRGNSK